MPRGGRPPSTRRNIAEVNAENVPPPTTTEHLQSLLSLKKQSPRRSSSGTKPAVVLGQRNVLTKESPLKKNVARERNEKKSAKPASNNVTSPFTSNESAGRRNNRSSVALNKDPVSLANGDENFCPPFAGKEEEIVAKQQEGRVNPSIDSMKNRLKDKKLEASPASAVASTKRGGNRIPHVTPNGKSLTSAAKSLTGSDVQSGRRRPGNVIQKTTGDPKETEEKKLTETNESSTKKRGRKSAEAKPTPSPVETEPSSQTTGKMNEKETPTVNKKSAAVTKSPVSRGESGEKKTPQRRKSRNSIVINEEIESATADEPQNESQSLDKCEAAVKAGKAKVATSKKATKKPVVRASWTGKTAKEIQAEVAQTLANKPEPAPLSAFDTTGMSMRERMEAIRQRNIAEKMEMLKSLGLLDTKSKINRAKPPPMPVPDPNNKRRWSKDKSSHKSPKADDKSSSSSKEMRRVRDGVDEANVEKRRSARQSVSKIESYKDWIEDEDDEDSEDGGESGEQKRKRKRAERDDDFDSDDASDSDNNSDGDDSDYDSDASFAEGEFGGDDADGDIAEAWNGGAGGRKNWRKSGGPPGVQVSDTSLYKYQKNPEMGQDFFGPVPGVPMGEHFISRMEANYAGVHRPPVSGIAAKTKSGGAFSICISGGGDYSEDLDFGEMFTYSGSGGRDLSGTKDNPKNLRTAAQTRDQELTGPNLALSMNVESGQPVRVIRGFKGDPKYAPTWGYRYDGLYRVMEWRWVRGQSGYKVLSFAFKRLDDQESPPWLASKGKDDDEDKDGSEDEEEKEEENEASEEVDGNDGEGETGIETEKDPDMPSVQYGEEEEEEGEPKKTATLRKRKTTPRKSKINANKEEENESKVTCGTPSKPTPRRRDSSKANEDQSTGHIDPQSSKDGGKSKEVKTPATATRRQRGNKAGDESNNDTTAIKPNAKKQQTPIKKSPAGKKAKAGIVSDNNELKKETQKSDNNKESQNIAEPAAAEKTRRRGKSKTIQTANTAVVEGPITTVTTKKTKETAKTSNGKKGRTTASTNSTENDKQLTPEAKLSTNKRGSVTSKRGKSVEMKLVGTAGASEVDAEVDEPALKKKNTNSKTARQQQQKKPGSNKQTNRKRGKPNEQADVNHEEELDKENAALQKQQSSKKQKQQKEPLRKSRRVSTR